VFRLYSQGRYSLDKNQKYPRNEIRYLDFPPMDDGKDSHKLCNAVFPRGTAPAGRITDLEEGHFDKIGQRRYHTEF
jgi:hypothetical protein